MVGREETAQDSEILEFIESSEDPFITTTEVAEFLDFSKKGARKRLYKLSDKGLVDFKRIGRAPGWWITEEGRERLSEDTET